MPVLILLTRDLLGTSKVVALLSVPRASTMTPCSGGGSTVRNSEKDALFKKEDFIFSKIILLQNSGKSQGFFYTVLCVITGKFLTKRQYGTHPKVSKDMPA